MAMKPIALFILVALLSAATMAATAKTITSSQGSADATSAAAVAGPALAANNSQPQADAAIAKPSKKTLKKAKVTPPPPMHDPN
jgi:hypothetical protein